LILSAGLKERLPANAPPDRPLAMKAANAWMLALGERFHLVSGECFDTSIPAANRPRVKVSIVEPMAGPARPLGGDEAKSPPDFAAGDIAAIPPLPWPAIVTVSESRRSYGETGEEGRERFAESEWPARMRKAEQLLRDVEFLTPWPGECSEPRPALRGAIDFLWKEADGWHLLAFTHGELQAWVGQRQFGGSLASATAFDLRTGNAKPLTMPVDFNTVARKLQASLRTTTS
jgi:hypothetical protein